MNCIRCSACLNACPVYERTGGHAYNSVYPGPIGAILTPQLVGIGKPGPDSLPYASSLCGACYEVCPVKINIPEVLIHLRGKVIRKKQSAGLTGKLNPENVAMQAMAKTFSDPVLYEGAQKLARIGQWPLARSGAIHSLPVNWPAGPGAGHQTRTGSDFPRVVAREAQAVSGAKDVILSRTRHALRDVPEEEKPEDVPIERGYRKEDEASREEILDQFTEYVAEYEASVHRVGEEDLPGQ